MGPNVERANLVGCDREGVDIGLFTCDSVFQLFWCHVTNDGSSADHRTILPRDERIGDDRCDPKVSYLCRTPLRDKNVPLGM